MTSGTYRHRHPQRTVSRTRESRPSAGTTLRNDAANDPERHRQRFGMDGELIRNVIARESGDRVPDARPDEEQTGSIRFPLYGDASWEAIVKNIPPNARLDQAIQQSQQLRYGRDSLVFPSHPCEKLGGTLYVGGTNNLVRRVFETNPAPLKASPEKYAITIWSTSNKFQAVSKCDPA